MQRASAAYAQALRYFRSSDKRKLSQEDLADLAEINRTHMGKLERGEIDVRLWTMIRVSKALGVSLVQFAGEVEKNLKRRNQKH